MERLFKENQEEIDCFKKTIKFDDKVVYLKLTYYFVNKKKLYRYLL